MSQENRALRWLAAGGYCNFAALVYLLLYTMKASEPPLLAVAGSSAVTVFGCMLYYVFWGKAFPNVPRSSARRFMRPYILGAAIAVLAMTLLLLLNLLRTYPAQAGTVSLATHSVQLVVLSSHTKAHPTRRSSGHERVAQLGPHFVLGRATPPWRAA